MLLFFFKIAVSLRYRVTVRGYEKVKRARAQSKKGMIFLSSHTAEIDPLIMIAKFWGYFRLKIVTADFVFYIPIVRTLIKKAGCIPIPSFDLSTNSYKRWKIEQIYEEITERINRGENILIYPAGGLKTGPLESLGAASGMEQILKRIPHPQIVLVRFTGLWGSVFSKAVTGKRPNVLKTYTHGLKIVLKNLIFFTPRRKVTIECEIPTDFPLHGDRKEINYYLESWYNRNGPEEITLVSFSPWKQVVPEIVKRPKQKPFCVDAIPQEIKDKVIDEVALLTRIDKNLLTPEKNFAEDLGLDSLDRSQLVLILKDQFGVPNVTANDLTTIESMMAFAAHLRHGEELLEDEEQPPSNWGKEEGRPQPIYPEAENLLEAFFKTADRMKDFLAAADFISGEVTYSRMKLGVIMIAQYIKKLPGDRVGIMLPAAVAADMAILATMLAGKTPVMINWTLGERNLNAAVDKTGITVCLSSWRFLDRLANAELGKLNECIVLLDDVKFDFTLREKLVGLCLSKRRASTILSYFRADQIQKTDPCVILFTSGTENLPKGVPLSHENVMENHRAAEKMVNLHANDVMFGILPPFHSFGFTVTGLLPVVSGLRVAYCANPTNGRQIAFGIELWKATLFCSAPTFLKTILRVAKRGQLDSLRLVITGAEKTHHELFEKMRSVNPKVLMLEGYGITECAPILTLNRPNKEPKGVGEPLPGVELCIVHPEQHTVMPRGSSGLILAHGKNVFSGYLDNHSADPFIELENKRWYITGDLGNIDQEGRLTIEGRLKRFIKIGGEMVSLTAIEEVLEEAAPKFAWPLSQEVPSLAVCPVEEEGAKGTIHLFSTFKTSVEQVNQALQEAGMSNLIRVRDVHVLFAIPILGTGKVDYRELANKLQGKE
ncbi:MAG: AMP-binding protein [Chlamydiales bacterium]